jgi:hypothetical protein
MELIRRFLVLMTLAASLAVFGAGCDDDKADPKPDDDAEVTEDADVQSDAGGDAN